MSSDPFGVKWDASYDEGTRRADKLAEAAKGNQIAGLIGAEASRGNAYRDILSAMIADASRTPQGRCMIRRVLDRVEAREQAAAARRAAAVNAPQELRMGGNW